MLTKAFPLPFLLTIIQPIAMHLLAACNGDLEAARQSASDSLDCYRAETEIEMRLAARIIAFNLQANEALAQAADPTMSVTHQIRLRSGAVSLSREADKADRRLQKLQQERREGIPQDPHAQPDPIPPSVQKAAALVATTGGVAAYAKAHGITFTEALKRRQRDKNLAARAAKDADRATAALASAVKQAGAALTSPVA